MSFQFTDYCLLDGYAVPLATLKQSSPPPSPERNVTNCESFSRQPLKTRSMGLLEVILRPKV
ncbi:MAG: hypothetical protein EWV50_13325 [Microcystis aeruginosa Ma_MB_F_20061100_S20]|uniref:Uncharacterized protein n=1 Tax=Microcystis aeruginosa Ma_MB_F_20061100_S20D TaxID=2486253 RepID=A0A552EW92_MICAE|nr:MAG: hypothetical protein EWV50_13325 [Microcystis aeruginosa Ma_MB_F_20061100_S20]TRU38731.1 MAG: hypothetical protein EWV78_04600 [Microcystis aeruginosa Ma_MB_F_20061100_S20D]